MVDAAPSSPGRLPTGIAGLDVVLRGGLVRGGTYLVMGGPGTGKTTLAAQLCFRHVADGGRALFVTLLTESHARLLANLRAFAFFDPAPVGDALYVISGAGELEQGGVDGLSDLLRRTVHERRATLLVLDGLGTVADVAGSPLALKRFLIGLDAAATMLGCTTLLLGPAGDGGAGAGAARPEQAMVDGLLELARVRVGPRTVREVEVHKLRGSPFLEGRHGLAIDDRGLVVHPRTEALLRTPAAAAPPDGPPLPLDVAGLDAMLRGGLRAGTATLVLGPTGAGKTLLGLHFLAAGVRRGEPGLHFGFYEMPPRLLRTADAFGLALGAAAADGRLELLWQPPIEQDLDALAERLLGAVRRRAVRRLVIDGLGGFETAVVYPERRSAFFSALTNELRALGVTTLVCAELARLVGRDLDVSLQGVSALAENVLLLRAVELRSRLTRLLSIVKLREGDYDPAIRELRITATGIEVADPFEGAEAVLTGLAHLPHGGAQSPGDEGAP